MTTIWRWNLFLNKYYMQVSVVLATAVQQVSLNPYLENIWYPIANFNLLNGYMLCYPIIYFQIIFRYILGIPSEEQLVRGYCKLQAAAYPIPQWNFYVTLSYFRLASIAQVCN